MHLAAALSAFADEDLQGAPNPFFGVPTAAAEIAPYDPSPPAETWPDGRTMAPEMDPMDESSLPNDDAPDATWPDDSCPTRPYLPGISWFGLRHSHTHGRHVGLGWPLTGSSWLNRPYYVGGELGTLWMTRSVEDSVSRDTDLFGGIYLGWDWDYYWGGELKFNWSTPELTNSQAPDAPRTDSLFLWSYSLMYYPWGDAMLRPYWRCGIGNTAVDFPTDWGSRHDEWLLTFPLGIGVKYPVRRWLAARAEVTDQLALGQNGIPTQHNLTLTFGLEWRFGARPKSYWPWYPSRHIW
ncbi:MAG: porin family protein [Planctomycetes bacterium]|nr:porin family protein [Planctomycetota bacterium]